MTIRKFTGGKSSGVSTALNVIGMAMAFATMYIIMAQVNYDLGYNKKVPDADRIYAVAVPDWYEEGRYMTRFSRPICESLISSISSVESGGMSYLGGNLQTEPYYTSPDAESGVSLSRSSFSSGAVKMFGIEAVAGNLDKMETLSDGIALSESRAAEMSVGAGDILYRKNSSGEPGPVTVTAIFKDFPKNSDLYGFDCFDCIGDQSIKNSSEWSYPYFVKLHSPDDKEEFERQALELMLKLSAREADGPMSEEDIAYVEQRLKIRLFPFTDLYFNKTVNTPGRSGSRTSTYTQFAIAVLVIIIAFINFINFFFAQIPLRLRNFNTRKILGASRMQLTMRVIRQSVVMIAIALAVAALLVQLFVGSSLASLISSPADFSSNTGIAAATVILAFVLSVLSSLYPAYHITSFPPALAMRGSLGSGSRGKAFRTGLIGVQFLISMTLIICVSFVTMQREYMLKHSLGFDRSNLLQVYTSYNIARNMNESVSDRLRSDPEIKDVTWADGEIVQPGRMGWGRMFKGEDIYFQCYPVSWNFLDFMGIDIVEGRDFSRSDESSEDGVFIFNEAARDKFGLTLEDKIMGHSVPTEIAGFCKNFNYRPLSDGVDPFALYIFGKTSWKVRNNLYIRTMENCDIPRLMDRIQNILHEMDPTVPKDEIDVRFFDDRMESLYRSEKRTSRIISLFTALAIAISLMGVFGLVMFEAEYRRKEIGIRRVSGARVSDILTMFNLKFAKIVLVCFAIAVPLSWYIVDRYLQGFAYRMPIHWWIFALALLAVLAVTVGVVTLRCLSAATSDPVDSIKTE